MFSDPNNTSGGGFFTPPRWVLPVAVGMLLAVVLVVWIARGFYRLNPGEAAAVQTFGAARDEPESRGGLHWHWSPPIGRVTVLQVQKSRIAEVGFQTLPDGRLGFFTGENWQRDYDAASMISGDLNLLEAQAVAQYRIRDLNAYLFRADDPGITFEYRTDDRTRVHSSHPAGRPDGQTIKDAIEIALRRAVGQRTIDGVLVSEREVIESETLVHAQDRLDAWRTGLLITSIQLQEVKPPDEVQAAFDDVLQAREERDKRINEALAFESRTLPEARGEAERIRKSAEAYRAERIASAEGEAGRFLDILSEYRAAPEIIARRMYLQTMDRVLPRTRQLLLAGGEIGPIIIDGAPGGRTVVTSP